MLKRKKNEQRQTTEITQKQRLRQRILYAVGVVWMVLSYWGVEVYAARYLDPVYTTGLTFGFLWALLLTAVALALPRWIGKVVYGLTFYAFAIFAAVQCCFYAIFGQMMWVGDARYAGEGGNYVSDVLGLFSKGWWIATILLMVIGCIGCFLVPHGPRPNRLRVTCVMVGISAVIGLFTYPAAVFQQDANAWGLQAEYRRALSREGIYTTMYDAHKVYQVCGIYQTTVKDIWQHNIYPATPMYRRQINEQSGELDAWFAARPAHEDNDMTGLFAGKNVVLVLMESMDDWLINETDTPTISRLMDEGINFTNLYTPSYGSVRTFNTEFCVNTGIYLPTNGQYAFDYCTNDFSESLPNLFRALGYSAEAFHYNASIFYNRGVMEPAMGYEAYNSYIEAGMSEEEQLSDTSVFENEELMDKFFHGEEGEEATGFFNFIISRSAHMTYAYDEELSQFALAQYPDYKGGFESEEVDCIRAKARCCDDLFTELLRTLEENGHLEDTVIIGFTDHYAYGMQDQSLLMEKSNVAKHLLVEKTPFFIWSADGPDMEVTKTLNTSDILPTVLNLFGVESDYHYLGQDAFDPGYAGYVIFSNNSWITASGAYENGEVIASFTEEGPTAAEISEMNDLTVTYIHMNNLLLESDYYGRKNAGKT